jgi:hypothetical protein
MGRCFNLTAAGLIGLVACAPGTREEVPEEPLSVEPVAEDTVPIDTLTVRIEGMETQMPVRRHVSPVEYPLGFRTYVPEDMTVEYLDSGVGEVVRFQAAFGGVSRPEAFLELTALPPDMERRDVSDSLRTIADSLGYASTSAGGFPWAVEEYVRTGEDVGVIALGEKDGKWFYFRSRYPAEFGDGMHPRMGVIFDNWIWLTTEAGLGGPPAGRDAEGR